MARRNIKEKHFKTIHRTKHIVQSQATSTCSLHTIYFIIIMMDPLNKTALAKNVNVGQYIRHYYDTKMVMHPIRTSI